MTTEATTACDRMDDIHERHRLVTAPVIAFLIREVDRLSRDRDFYESACIKAEDEVAQILGKAICYPEMPDGAVDVGAKSAVELANEIAGILGLCRTVATNLTRERDEARARLAEFQRVAVAEVARLTRERDEHYRLYHVLREIIDDGHDPMTDDQVVEELRRIVAADGLSRDCPDIRAKDAAILALQETADGLYGERNRFLCERDEARAEVAGLKYRLDEAGVVPDLSPEPACVAPSPTATLPDPDPGGAIRLPGFGTVLPSIAIRGTWIAERPDGEWARDASGEVVRHATKEGAARALGYPPEPVVLPEPNEFREYHFPNGDAIRPAKNADGWWAMYQVKPGVRRAITLPCYPDCRREFDSPEDAARALAEHRKGATL